MAEIRKISSIRAVTIGRADLSLEKAVFHQNAEAASKIGKFDSGQYKSVRIKCVSGVG